MTFLVAGTQAIQAIAQEVKQFDTTAIITSIVQTGIFSFLVFWIFKVFSKMNASLKQEVEKLKQEVEKLKESENKWFRKYHRLANIITRRKCVSPVGECAIMNEYMNFIEKEGETV